MKSNSLENITVNVALRSIQKLLVAFFLASGLCAAATADTKEDKIVNFKAVEKIHSDSCAYMGDTALEVNYQLFSVDFTDLVVTGTDSTGFTSEIVRSEVERGRGNLTLFFDAGSCLQSISLHLD